MRKLPIIALTTFATLSLATAGVAHADNYDFEVTETPSSSSSSTTEPSESTTPSSTTKKSSTNKGDCDDVLRLAVPGTDQVREGTSTSKASPDFKTLAGKDVVFLAYPAELGAGGTLKKSMQKGVSNGIKIIDEFAEKCKGGKVALIGSSQGAGIAGDIAAAVADGKSKLDPENIATVQLLGDPKKSPRDTSYSPKVETVGLLGARNADALKKIKDVVLQHCVPGDIVCDVLPKGQVATIAATLQQPGMEKSFPGNSLAEAMKSLTASTALEVYSKLPPESQTDFSGLLDAANQVQAWDENKLHYQYGKYVPKGESKSLYDKAVSEFLSAK